MVLDSLANSYAPVAHHLTHPRAHLVLVRFMAFKSGSKWNIRIISLSYPHEPLGRSPGITRQPRHIHLWILHPAASAASSRQTLGLVCGQPGSEDFIDVYDVVYTCLEVYIYTYLYLYKYKYKYIYIHIYISISRCISLFISIYLSIYLI